MVENAIYAVPKPYTLNTINYNIEASIIQIYNAFMRKFRTLRVDIDLTGLVISPRKTNLFLTHL